MKKVFLVEIEYIENENNGEVIYDYSLENMLKQWMEGFVDTKSVKKDFKLNVRDVTGIL